MNGTRYTLLTGATGLLGRYLLRDLLASGHRVAVLVRDSREATAADRVAELLALGEEALGRQLPPPRVFNGDLTVPGLGLGMAERHWMATHARAVLHSAACVSYQATADGEPWETNVNGTKRLLETCQALGLADVHHVSTAFVCGDRSGTVHEDELDCGNGPGNAYERSKFAAEQLVRSFPGVRVTVYRPSVVVGDSRTGYTSTYHHFYRFLELAVRLSSPAEGTRPTPGGRPRRRRLPLRLPLTGEETQNLVPVDWVSRALVELLGRPRWHGRTFHLVAREAVRLREVKGFAEELLHLEGVQWAGPDGLADPTSLEELVLEQFRDYWSYLHSNLEFDCRNTLRALPDLPPPRFGRDLMARLLAFALEDQWGRRRAPPRSAAPPPESDCAHYLEQVLPAQARRSPAARALPAGFTFALDIHGPGGGQWTFRRSGAALEVRRGLDPDAAVTYRTDAATFTALVRGRQSPQNAFFDGRIEIAGDLEKALKLATLIEQFLTELPRQPSPAAEALHAADY